MSFCNTKYQREICYLKGLHTRTFKRPSEWKAEFVLEVIKSMENDLKEGVDFYFNENGRMVLTKAYHLKRGHCCRSGCMECPYDYSNKVDPNIPEELQLNNKD